MQHNDERQTASIEQVARILGISRASAYRAAERGEIPCIRIGGRVLVPRSALDRLLGGQTPENNVLN